MVGGYLVPKGALMNVCMRVMHRRADYFDDADDFRPERWLEDAEQGGSGCPARSYLPFSTKPRICQGEDFARILFVSGLASLVQKLRVEPESDEPPTRTNIGVGIMGTYTVRVGARTSTSGGRDQRSGPPVSETNGRRVP